MPREGAGTTGQGGQVITPTPRDRVPRASSNKVSKLNERAADLRWKIMNKMGTWNLRG